jgi:DNA-binding response OmpR family regulator
MSLIVVAEDDASTRALVSSVLSRDGHEVLQAEDGVQALALVESRQPDLLLSDVQMPGMSGFDLLAAVRRNPTVATTPVILLTSLQDRVHMRIGMTSGADDYVTKPFRSGELREAVFAQLKKREMQGRLQSMAVDAAVRTALETHTEQLSKLYERRLASALSERWPSGSEAEEEERFAHATVLFVDIPCYASIAEKLSSAELSELVKRFYGSAGDTVYLFGARHMQFVGEGLLAIYADASDTPSVSHGLRAVRAAMGLNDAARSMTQYLKSRYPDRHLPDFAVSVALHSGAVTLARLQDPLHDATVQILPVGDVVTTDMLLQKQVQAMGWSAAATVTALRGITGAVRVGRRALVHLPGRADPLDIAELLELVL